MLATSLEIVLCTHVLNTSLFLAGEPASNVEVVNSNNTDDQWIEVKKHKSDKGKKV